MNVNLTSVLAIFFLIMLAVLGHGAWHGPLTGLMNVIVSLLTGSHVVG